MIRLILSPATKPLFGILLVVSASVLGAALISQYVFGLHPCELCIFQRVPYVALIAVSGLGVVLSSLLLKQQLRLILLCGILFAVSTGLATYHAGVEKKIFTGPTACSSQPSDRPLTIEELKAQIMGAPLVACNEPAWKWHGITMAGMNAALSLVMMIYVFVQYSNIRKRSV